MVSLLLIELLSLTCHPLVHTFSSTNQHSLHALLLSPGPHTGQASADPAEDVVDDHDAAVDEEEEDDEDEVLVEEDQIQATVGISSMFASVSADEDVSAKLLLCCSSGWWRRRRG